MLDIEFLQHAVLRVCNGDTMSMTTDIHRHSNLLIKRKSHGSSIGNINTNTKPPSLLVYTQSHNNGTIPEDALDGASDGGGISELSEPYSDR